MRPTPIIWMVLGTLVGIGGIVAAAVAFYDGAHGKAWFYWIAPLMAIGFGLMLLAYALGYYVRVTRVEMRGRPRQ